jgi:ribosomal protein S18 acetylase RimI-like enzyme
MIIRKYRDSDFDQMMELHREVLQKENVYRGAGIWEEDLLHINEHYFNRKGCFVVGFIKEKLVAMGAYRKVNEKMAEIVRMRVHPEFQGKGYGCKILIELETIAIQSGFKELVLETDERLLHAIKLYQKNGYTYWKQEEIHGFNCIWYKKRAI